MSVSPTLLGSLLFILLGGVIWSTASNLSRGALPLVRPQCFSCGAPLPIASWLPWGGLLHRDACPLCGWNQDRWRRLFEIAWIAFCLLAGLRFEDGSLFLGAVVYGAILCLLLLVDLQVGLIYFGTLLVGGVAVLIFSISEGSEAIASASIGLVLAAVVMLAFALLGRLLLHNSPISLIQTSDIYVGALAGAMVGADDALQAIFLGVLVALVVMIGARVSYRQIKQIVPIAPFICIGAMLAMLI